MAAVLLALGGFSLSSAEAKIYQPGQGVCGKENCYWETPMDIRDTEAVWAMLQSPITVIDGGQKDTFYLLAEPEEGAERVGEVTGASQGVHVLETLESGWSYVECYSSSFHDSKLKLWNQLVSGYIRTELLVEKEVQPEYGIVIDKLTQRLYLFYDGELMDTLLVSTGLPNDKQPYNETRSGEFMIVSPVGDFPSGNMTCGYGMRFNNGDLLHEVPYLTNKKDGRRDYNYCEKELGRRASHGCIRVQRRKTPNGVNMQWIWNTLRSRMGTRLVLWEDWHGRQIPLPEDNLQLFYNPNGGKSYHSAATCTSVKDEYLPLTAFSYAQLLEEPFSKLVRCDYCTPALRPEEIETINKEYEADEGLTVKIY